MSLMAPMASLIRARLWLAASASSTLVPASWRLVSMPPTARRVVCCRASIICWISAVES
ncbi:hypothetical protein D3C80_1671000 [compost metagenome]